MHGLGTPAGADTAENDQISAQLVRDLYDRAQLAIVLLLLLLIVIRWALQPVYHLDGRLRGLFLFLIAVSATRLVLLFIPYERRNALASPQLQFMLFEMGVALTSGTLGALIFLAWPQLDTARIAILAVLASGMISGAIMSLGFSPLVYATYMLPPVGGMFYRAITDPRPPWGAEILATAFAIYAVAVVLISFDQRHTRRQAIAMRLRLSDQVLRDTLTKLHNRRFLQEFMPVETDRLARDVTDLEQGRHPQRNSALAIFMLDLDFFKQVNDTHGHEAGDAVLLQTAQVIHGALRRSDNLVRWGGEEFVAVAWLKQREHARVVAEKMRRAVEGTAFLLPDGQVLRKTVSLGFAMLPFYPDRPRQITWEQALALADAALYVAKAEGRNRWIGAASAPQHLPEDPQELAKVVHDLMRAELQGLVTLERSTPAKEAASA